MARNEKGRPIRQFVKRLLRAGLKSAAAFGTFLASTQHNIGTPESQILTLVGLSLGLGGPALDELIFATLEDKDKRQREKSLDLILNDIRRTLKSNSDDIGNLVIGKALEDKDIENTIASTRQTVYLLQDPDNAPLPDYSDALRTIVAEENKKQTNEIKTHIDTQTSELRQLFAQYEKKQQKLFLALLPRYARPAQLQIMLHNLPSTGKDLFGRDDELQVLDEAWADKHTHIVSFVAWGGVGKSALVNEWLNKMEHNNWRGAQAVLGWSFYSQGSRDTSQASADEFIDKALRFFDDPEPEKGSAWDKGARLAGLIRNRKTLLILDGVEPLQYPPGAMQGHLKDTGLKALLKNLALGHRGLCIVTTRQELKDLDDRVGKTVNRIELENLPVDAGVQLLKKLGADGSDKELIKAVKDFGGHALALNLLGTYLSTVYEGDIRKRDLVPNLMDEPEQGGHAIRVMKSYEIWLKGKPELDVLYLMGLFDRPADSGAIDALRAEPVIKGLTEKLRNLSVAKWKFAVKHLRDLRLLAKKDEDRPDVLDCHPLVREYFGEKLRKTSPKGFKEAHSRLYEYYKNLPEKELPDTLDEMQPLFAAVAHGCLAGRHQEARYDIYVRRIKRGNEYYIQTKLGAFGSWLSVLSNFFDEPWNRPTTNLTDSKIAVVLSEAGFALRGLGRLREAAQPIKAGMEASIEQEDWQGAARDANNLSELYLTMGDVKQAVQYARDSVEYADKNRDMFERYSNRTTLADALHQAGQKAEAEKLFKLAEKMQKDDQPQYPYLYSVRGYRFCDLLLSQGRYEEVQKRAAKSIEIAKRDNRLLDIALDNLSLGRAFLLEAIEEKTGRFTKAADLLDRAVDGLRQAGAQEFIIRGLLARAELHRVQKDFDRAWTDLAEVLEIAERSEMKLHLADYHLEAARLSLAEGKTKDVAEHTKAAEKLIDDTRYHRRDAELKELKDKL